MGQNLCVRNSVLNQRFYSLREATPSFELVQRLRMKKTFKKLPALNSLALQIKTCRTSRLPSVAYILKFEEVTSAKFGSFQMRKERKNFVLNMEDSESVH